VRGEILPPSERLNGAKKKEETAGRNSRHRRKTLHAPNDQEEWLGFFSAEIPIGRNLKGKNGGGGREKIFVNVKAGGHSKSLATRIEKGKKEGRGEEWRKGILR